MVRSLSTKSLFLRRDGKRGIKNTIIDNKLQTQNVRCYAKRLNDEPAKKGAFLKGGGTLPV